MHWSEKGNVTALHVTQNKLAKTKTDLLATSTGQTAAVLQKAKQ